MKLLCRRTFLKTASAVVGASSAITVPTRVLASPVLSDVCQVGPFVCRATFSIGKEVDALDGLPELQRELQRVLAVAPPQEPIDVFLFGDQTEYGKFLQEHFPEVPYRRALFVRKNRQSSVYVYRQESLDIDLRHECTHALLHSGLDVVPLWLDEGLAEYFEVAPEKRAFGHPHFRSLKWNMRLGMMRTIDALEQRSDLSEMDTYDYRFSWAWTHFMLHGPQAAYNELLAFLDAIRRGAVPGQLSGRLSLAMPDATEQMIRHFKHWRQA
jgi:hypothetical protein